MAKIRDINIAKDIVKEYSTEEILKFVARALKEYSVNDIPEREHFNLVVDIVSALDDKLNGQKGPKLL